MKPKRFGNHCSCHLQGENLQHSTRLTHESRSYTLNSSRENLRTITVKVINEIMVQDGM